ncbi:NrfD/PsrC family molybdoenzyme membrane anchor subunit [Mesobacillus sp. LC4]
MYLIDKEVKEMDFHAYWDYRVALDLFLGGVGIGVFLLAAYFSLVFKEKSLKITRLGFILAPVLVGLGVFALLTELGKPFRMLSTFINVNPTSVTSWGGFLQTIFILLSFVIFLVVWKYKQNAYQMGIFKGLVIAGSVFALAVGIYHGLLLMSLGVAGWANGLIPVMFLVSSILSGSSVLMVVEAVFMRSIIGRGKEVYSETAVSSDAQNFTYSKLLGSLAAIQALLILTWRISLNSAGTEAIIAYQNLISHFGVYWWIFVVAIGLVIPLTIAGYSTLKKIKMSFYTAMIFTVVVLIGSYAFKHIILYSGQIPLAGL